MVGGIHHVQCSPRSQSLAHFLDQSEIGQPVPGALKKEHREVYSCEVLGTLEAGAAGGVQGEAEEYQSTDVA